LLSELPSTVDAVLANQLAANTAAAGVLRGDLEKRKLELVALQKALNGDLQSSSSSPADIAAKHNQGYKEIAAKTTSDVAAEKNPLLLGDASTANLRDLLVEKAQEGGIDPSLPAKDAADNLGSDIGKTKEALEKYVKDLDDRILQEQGLAKDMRAELDKTVAALNSDLDKGVASLEASVYKFYGNTVVDYLVVASRQVATMVAMLCWTLSTDPRPWPARFSASCRLRPSDAQPPMRPHQSVVFKPKAPRRSLPSRRHSVIRCST